VIPVSLIKESSRGSYIYTAQQENGKLIARRRVIETGRNYNGMAEVISGLDKGDKIITTGYNNLVDGQLIRVNGTQD
jgi:multidrug efflux pump subunit AcrA (membrane-fusion protein)